ncbi:MAG TPA: TerD family protein, partial [Chitinophaga sp.]
MAINLQKGQREQIGATKFTVGLGWDVNAGATGAAFDLDASVFLLGANGKILADEYFIFYNNKTSPD